ncbi:MAG: glutaminyl-peptide cyclotransferase [Caldilineaceae bacterium]
MNANATPTPTSTATLAPTSTATPQPSPTNTTTLTSTETFTTTLPIVVKDPPPTPEPEGETEIPVYGYNVIAQYPHDPNAFTQGLILVDGVLYEGTGRRGQSTLRRADLETGEVLQGVRLPDQYFGEGITLFNNRIYQLTWTSGTGFILDPQTFELIDTFTYPTQGWGITHDGEQLIMSDGTPNLYFLDPETLERTRQLPVTANGEPVYQLNELEYIDGLVYANIWQTDRIVQIDPATGEVVAVIDMTGLLPARSA